MRKRISSVILATAMVSALVLSGCSNKSDKNNNTDEKATEATSKSDNNTESGKTVEKLDDVFTNYDKDDTWDDTAVSIELSDEDVVIDKKGTYILSGTLKNGQVYINVGDEDKVHLVLNGVDITNESSAAIFVENADKVAITLAEGSENVLTDGGNAETTDADGCLYSKDDLTINGTGSLIVNGNVSNGIDCNNDIKIVSGNIEVNAVNNGIKAKQDICIKDGTIKVIAEDAIKASSKSNDEEGTFYMEGGNLELEAGDDGITATVSITVAGGKIDVNAVGKSTNCDGEENIADGCLTEK